MIAIQRKIRPEDEHSKSCNFVKTIAVLTAIAIPIITTAVVYVGAFKLLNLQMINLKFALALKILVPAMIGVDITLIEISLYTLYIYLSQRKKELKKQKKERLKKVFKQLPDDCLHNILRFHHSVKLSLVSKNFNEIRQKVINVEFLNILKKYEKEIYIRCPKLGNRIKEAFKLLQESNKIYGLDKKKRERAYKIFKEISKYIAEPLYTNTKSVIIHTKAQIEKFLFLYDQVLMCLWIKIKDQIRHLCPSVDDIHADIKNIERDDVKNIREWFKDSKNSKYLKNIEALKLDAIEFYYNDLNGSLKNFEFKVIPYEITKLTNLKGLSFFAHRIKDFFYLKSLTKLEELSIGNMKILEDLSFLSSLTKLRRLDLRGNKITDISVLKNLTQLQELDISDNRIKDVSHLKSLINLKVFIYTRNPIPKQKIVEFLRSSNVFLPTLFEVVKFKENLKN
ncbi:MAG: leucine-rich repeat domain-containing protein [Candidatus Thorarchaeota archaeon]